MQVGIYARVSTQRQAQAQTIDQQLTRLRAYVEQKGWQVADEHIYRDDGFSGASLSRPGLDRLRDRVALAELDVVVITAPDRLARKYLHQVLLIEEMEKHGCRVEFTDRPMSTDPNDQLLLQIRGAVAEYERSLISERMRRGKVAKLRTGQLLPWTRGHYGYTVDPDHPRDPHGVHIDDFEGAIVRQIFAWYGEEDATLYVVAKKLEEAQVTTPRGCDYWTGCSVRHILRDPAYTGITYGNRCHSIAARQRVSPLRPVGPGISHVIRPQDEWIGVPIPAIVTPEVFEQVQEKLSHNQQRAPRNTKHAYVLSGHVSCGACRLTCGARQADGHRYYACRGRTDKHHRSEVGPCRTRYIPADQLDELVWTDLCAILLEPEHVAHALERAQGGAWLPQELQSRRHTLEEALAGIERQQKRLLDAYLGGALELPEFERKRSDLNERRHVLHGQQHQLDDLARQRIEVAQVAQAAESFCAQIRAGLAGTSFEQKRALVELLIDQVVVTNEEVEIRYVMPISPHGARQPFCHLRLDYRGGVSERVQRSRRRGGADRPFHRRRV
jgi:site-specific DNA recombinase